MKWFGEPWPTPGVRATVCEDDDAQVPAPLGIPCARCAIGIVSSDRGVQVPYDEVSVVYHLQCFLAEVVGDVAAAEITKRMEATMPKTHPTGWIDAPTQLAECVPGCDWLQTRQHEPGCQS